MLRQIREKLEGECTAFLASGSDPTGAGLSTLTCTGSLLVSATEIPVKQIFDYLKPTVPEK